MVRLCCAAFLRQVDRNKDTSLVCLFLLPENKYTNFVGLCLLLPESLKSYAGWAGDILTFSQRGASGDGAVSASQPD